MKKGKRNRLITILAILSACTLGIYIILTNLSNNIVFFYPPSEISKIQINSNKVRVGGLVKEGSIVKSGKKVVFIITDHTADLEVKYEGLLPALFREKQGIVAEGKLVSRRSFKASKLLTKHDENYAPPEIRNLKTN